MRSNMID